MNVINYFKRSITTRLLEFWENTIDTRMVFICGTRRVGKSTLVLNESKNLSKIFDASIEYVSYENQIGSNSHNELKYLLESTLDKAKKFTDKHFFLILDEIQYVQNWQHLVKYYYDIAKYEGISNFRITLLGSSPIMMLKGKESLLGRAKTLTIPYWSFGEIKEAFNVDLENYLYFGSCPEIYQMNIHKNEVEWKEYYRNLILDKFFSEDAKFVRNKDLPEIVLKKIFVNLCLQSGNIVTYSKLYNYSSKQLNVDNIADCVNIFAECGFFAEIKNFSKSISSRISSNSKIIALNTALVSIHFENIDHKKYLSNTNIKGYILDNVVGSHLYNTLPNGMNYYLYYWRFENKYEIDYIVELPGKRIIAIEVKRTSTDKHVKNFNKFKEVFNKHRITFLTVGENNCDISIYDFLIKPASITLDKYINE